MAKRSVSRGATGQQQHRNLSCGPPWPVKRHEHSGAHDVDIHGAGLANQAIAQGASLQASQGTMEEVAAETGGKPYINQNEIKNGVALAAADDAASYEIGYYPDD